MKNLTIVFLISLGLSVFSCKPGPEPINYGEDDCALCRMTISDTRYGSELVTKKGKVYKFDAMECLASFVLDERVNKDDIHLQLVTDFNQPETFINAEDAFILQSKNVPSPMGMFLTAFANENEAKAKHDEAGGDLIKWNEVLQRVKNRQRPE